MQINWASMRQFIDDTGLIRNLNYLELSDAYHVWVNYENQVFEANIAKGSVESESFESDYKDDCILKKDINQNGQRNMMSNAPLNGETALVYNVSFKTSILTHDDPKNWVTVYGSDGINEYSNGDTYDHTTIKTTYLDFTPNFSYWIYIGRVSSFGQDGTLLKLNGQVAPLIQPEYGGQVDFIINKTIQPLGITDMSTQTGGAKLNYNSIVPGTNTVRLSISHPVGYVSNFEMELFIYRGVSGF